MLDKVPAMRIREINPHSDARRPQIITEPLGEHIILVAMADEDVRGLHHGDVIPF
jgi:hypothetical protein